MMSPRPVTSMLFVSGAQPERFAKAVAAGASLICIDLEDAVPPGGKAAARDHATAFLAAGHPGVAVRMNGIRTREGIVDLLALSQTQTLPALLFMPMVESPAEVAIVTSVLAAPGLGIVPLIETPEGLANADAIARAPQVALLMFGGGDLAAALGVELAWEPLAAARHALVLAAARAGIGLLDVPFIDLADPGGLLDEARRARSIGFSGKAAIHPAQIAAIEQAFRPSAAEIDEARAAVAAFAAAGGGAAVHGGRLIEAPLMRRYERIIAMAGEHDA